MVGEKSPGLDEYTGKYLANYKDFIGKEYLFGGTTINRKIGDEIKVKCSLIIKEGSGKLIFISGSNDLKYW